MSTLIEKSRKLSFKNKDKIANSSQVSCYYCCRTYSADDIKEWVDDGLTAICPYCSVDSVIPDDVGLTAEEKEKLHKHWFRR